MDKAKTIEDLMAQAESSQSYQDIFSMTTDHVTMFDYSLTLVPWFIGLFSVHFKIDEDGQRSIRMM